MLTLRCGSCGCRFQVPEKHAGRKFRCGKCQAVVVAPGVPEGTGESDATRSRNTKSAAGRAPGKAGAGASTRPSGEHTRRHVSDPSDRAENAAVWAGVTQLVESRVKPDGRKKSRRVKGSTLARRKDAQESAAESEERDDIDLGPLLVGMAAMFATTASLVLSFLALYLTGQDASASDGAFQGDRGSDEVLVSKQTGDEAGRPRRQSAIERPDVATRGDRRAVDVTGNARRPVDMSRSPQQPVGVNRAPDRPRQSVSARPPGAAVVSVPDVSSVTEAVAAIESLDLLRLEGVWRWLADTSADVEPDRVVASLKSVYPNLSGSAQREAMRAMIKRKVYRDIEAFEMLMAASDGRTRGDVFGHNDVEWVAAHLELGGRYYDDHLGIIGSAMRKIPRSETQATWSYVTHPNANVRKLAYVVLGRNSEASALPLLEIRVEEVQDPEMKRWVERYGVGQLKRRIPAPRGE